MLATIYLTTIASSVGLRRLTGGGLFCLVHCMLRYLAFAVFSFPWWWLEVWVTLLTCHRVNLLAENPPGPRGSFQRLAKGVMGLYSRCGRACIHASTSAATHTVLFGEMARGRGNFPARTHDHKVGPVTGTLARTCFFDRKTSAGGSASMSLFIAWLMHSSWELGERLKWLQLISPPRQTLL